MLGKRPRASMRRTSSVSLIGSSATTYHGENSPSPVHPKEKLKTMNSSPSPSSVICVSAGAAAAPRQVIGFHPKVGASPLIEEGPDQAFQTVARRSRANSSGSSGSPRSGLNDLVSSCTPKPWEHKDGGGVGLGIVASLRDGGVHACTGGPNELAVGLGDVLQGGPLYSVTAPYLANPVNGGISSHGFPHAQPFFSPVRELPPVLMQVPPSSVCGSDFNRHASNAHQNCHQAPSAFVPGPVPPVLAAEALSVAGGGCCNHGNSSSSSSFRAGGVMGGPRAAYSSTTVPWTKANGYAASSISPYGLSWGHQQADMEIDRADGSSLSLAASPIAFGNLGAGRNFGGNPNPFVSPTGGFGPNFLEACYLCKKKIGAQSDIFIYRGDRAFCSAECRQQQILQNERMEKCCSAAIKKSLQESRSTAQRGARVVSAGTAAAA